MSGSPRHMVKWWWNDTVAKLIKEKKEKFAAWKKARNGGNKEDIKISKQLYDQAKYSAKKEISKAQAEESKRFGKTWIRKMRETMCLR